MKTHALCLSFVVCLLAACAPKASLELYNNTGIPIVLVPDPATAAEVTLQGGESHQWTPASPAFEVRTFSWAYTTPDSPISQTFRNHTDGLGLLYRLQLQRDGRVYILDTSQTPPASQFSQQPPGFPIPPKIQPRQGN